MFCIQWYTTTGVLELHPEIDFGAWLNFPAYTSLDFSQWLRMTHFPCERIIQPFTASVWLWHWLLCLPWTFLIVVTWNKAFCIITITLWYPSGIVVVGSLTFITQLVSDMPVAVLALCLWVQQLYWGLFLHKVAYTRELATVLAWVPSSTIFSHNWPENMTEPECCCEFIF